MVGIVCDFDCFVVFDGYVYCICVWIIMWVNGLGYLGDGVYCFEC